MSATEHVLDERALRDVFGSYPTGVVAMAAIVEEQPVGIAASSFIPVSLAPPLVSVCVSKASSTWIRLRTAPRIGLSVLAEHQEGACRQLAGPDAERFCGLDWWGSKDGEILIGGAAAWFRCTLESELPAGDHQIALFRIAAAEQRDGVAPLVFHRSTFRRLHLAASPHPAAGEPPGGKGAPPAAAAS